MRSVELFAGAGGLALGLSNAGFHHAAVVEWNADACRTFRENQRLHMPHVEDWPLFEGDVRDFRFDQLGEVAVVSGGPPCQPFSMGGKHNGHVDKRNMFPQAVRAIRELRPRAFVFENVKGLLREKFADYFGYVQLQLSYPDITLGKSEPWIEHLQRLERHHTSNCGQEDYKVIFRLLNAADYGVPQRRERVFLVGFRSDLGVEWTFPEGPYSEDSLLTSQWMTGEYWDQYQIPARQRPEIPNRQRSRLERLRSGDLFGAAKKPWRTVRDAISDLPDPESHSQSSIPNHTLNPGARSYAGHTGSPLDEPAKTLKAGDHGVPGGENMLARPDGSVRYFSVREAARLQTFPDNYVFHGSWSEAMRQLGNAVPVRLAEAVGRSVSTTLATLDQRH